MPLAAIWRSLASDSVICLDSSLSFSTMVYCAVWARNSVPSAGFIGSWYLSWATISFRKTWLSIWLLIEIGRASCRERGVDLGGRRIIKKKNNIYVRGTL